MYYENSCRLMSNRQELTLYVLCRFVSQESKVCEDRTVLLAYGVPPVNQVSLDLRDLKDSRALQDQSDNQLVSLALLRRIY